MIRTPSFVFVTIQLINFLFSQLGYSQTAPVKYETYCNSKFSYCVDYPAQLLIPQGESGSGDGQVFSSKNNENTLTIYRDFRDNMDPDKKFDIHTAYAEDIDVTNSRVKKTVTYKKIGKNFYVVSGYQGSKIYYQKTILSDDQLITCILLYEDHAKQTYNALIDHIFKSFQ